MPTGPGRPIIKSLLFARLWFLLLHLKFGCHRVSYASEMKNNICMSTKFSKCSHANASSDQGRENQGSLQNLPLGFEKQVARALPSRLVVCPEFLFVRVSVCEEPRTRPHGRCWAGRHQMKKKLCPLGIPLLLCPANPHLPLQTRLNHPSPKAGSPVL